MVTMAQPKSCITLLLMCTSIFMLREIELLSPHHKFMSAQAHMLNPDDLPPEIAQNLRLHLGVFLRPIGSLKITHSIVKVVLLVEYQELPMLSMRWPKLQNCPGFSIDNETELEIQYFDEDNVHNLETLSRNANSRINTVLLCTKQKAKLARFRRISMRSYREVANVYKELQKLEGGMTFDDHGKHINMKKRRRRDQVNDNIFPTNVNIEPTKQISTVTSSTYNTTITLIDRVKRGVPLMLGLAAGAVTAIVDFFNRKKIKQSIHRLESKTDYIVDEVQRQGGVINTVIKTVDEMRAHYDKTLHFMSMALARQNDNILKNRYWLRNIDLDVRFLMFMRKLDKMGSMIRDRLRVYVKLQQGIIEPELITPSGIIHMLNVTKESMLPNLANYKLLYEDPSYYYANSLKGFFIFNSTHLALEFALPVYDIREKQYDLFKVETLPIKVQTNDTSYSAYSELVPQNRYLGIPKTSVPAERFFFEMSESDFSTCEKFQSTYSCSSVIKLLAPSSQTCLKSLYDNTLPLVKKLCKKTVTVTFKKDVFVNHLGKSYYMISADALDHLSIHCDNVLYPTRHVLKDVSLINLPCQCTLITNATVVLAEIAHCQKNNTVTIHSVNNLLSILYFQGTNVTVPYHDLLYMSEDMSTKPVLDLRVSQEDKFQGQISLSLDEVAYYHAKDHKVFVNRMDRLAAEKEADYFMSDPRLIESIALLLGIIGTLSFLINMIIISKIRELQKKLHYMSAAVYPKHTPTSPIIMGASMVPGASAFTVDLETPKSAGGIILYLLMLFGMFMAAACMAKIGFMLIKWIAKRMQIHKIHPLFDDKEAGAEIDVYLQMQRDNQEVILYVCSYKLSAPLSYYATSMPVKEIQIINTCMRKTLTIAWNTKLYGFKIEPDMTIKPHCSLSLPTLIQVPICKKYKTDHILGNGTLLPVCRLILAQCGIGINPEKLHIASNVHKSNNAIFISNDKVYLNQLSHLYDVNSPSSSRRDSIKSEIV